MKSPFLLNKNLLILLASSFLLFSNTAHASGYFTYELDKTRSKIEFTITEQDTQKYTHGSFGEFNAEIFTQMDTSIESWHQTYATWVNWEGNKGVWSHDEQNEPKPKNEFSLTVKLSSMKSDNRTSLLSKDSFNAEQFPTLHLKSIELTETSLGKGMIAELTIRDVTKTVYIPVTLDARKEGDSDITSLQGQIEIDLLDFNFVPFIAYLPPADKETGYRLGITQLPFVLNFNLAFTEGPGL